MHAMMGLAADAVDRNPEREVLLTVISFWWAVNDEHNTLWQ